MSTKSETFAGKAVLKYEGEIPMVLEYSLGDELCSHMYSTMSYHDENGTTWVFDCEDDHTIDEDGSVLNRAVWELATRLKSPVWGKSQGILPMPGTCNYK